MQCASSAEDPLEQARGRSRVHLPPHVKFVKVHFAGVVFVHVAHPEIVILFGLARRTATNRESITILRGLQLGLAERLATLHQRRKLAHLLQVQQTVPVHLHETRPAIRTDCAAAAGVVGRACAGRTSICSKAFSASARSFASRSFCLSACETVQRSDLETVALAMPGLGVARHRLRHLRRRRPCPHERHCPGPARGRKSEAPPR